MAGKHSGAFLVRWALEQLPVSHTFGIPGVHTTELYDELSKSKKITPVLVTHEGGGAFMADAISRTGGGRVGTLVIVPAAGLTHAMSGIAEAFLDGVPMLVISGGPRTDVPFGFQLHEMDQQGLLAAVTKGTWKISQHREIVPTLFEAYRRAVTGFPGPVYVEVPVNLQLFEGDAGDLPRFEPPADPPPPDAALIERAADLLAAAQKPALFVGWGAVDASALIAEIAERLGAPVATTLQGLSAFPGNHPLHTGMGFSRAAVPAAENAFRGIDALLAVGTRFGEIPTGSYGCVVPENLVHVDIDPAAIGRNYQAKVAVVADASAAAKLLLERLRARGVDQRERRQAVAAAIAADKKAYREEWAKHVNERVNPSLFFEELRRQLADDALLIVDDGNHTYLVAELFEVRQARGFVSPTDFNCMGYAVPGAIGAKLANPERQVAAIVGDGAFLMTGLEILTATALEAGIAYFVFHDGELSQIAQGQEIPYNRKTCTVLGDLRLDGIATATGAHFVAIDSNEDITDGIREALAGAAVGKPVVVDVRVDYSKRTRFTQGVVGTVLKRFPLRDKVRFVGRALYRKVTG